MILDILDKRIRKAFSDAAMQYDMLTSLHKEIGRELTKKIECQDPCLAVLDIGMGTGWFTNRLTDIFPDAMVVGIDFAAGMISRAGEKEGTFKIIQADAAQLPFKDGIFDVITSNLAYQWIDNLPQAFGSCRTRLKKDGKFCMTMFGHDTFNELFTAIEMCREEKNGNENFSMPRLANTSQVSEALKQVGFNDMHVTSEHIKVRYSDMMSLIKWVKDIGANAFPKEIYIGKDLLLRANDYYNDHFKDRLGVYATFEVIWVEGRK